MDSDAQQKQREIALDLIKKSEGDYEYTLRSAESALEWRQRLKTAMERIWSHNKEEAEVIVAYNQTKEQLEEAEADLEALREWRKRDGREMVDAEVNLMRKREELVKRISVLEIYARALEEVNGFDRREWTDAIVDVEKSCMDVENAEAALEMEIAKKTVDE